MRSCHRLTFVLLLMVSSTALASTIVVDCDGAGDCLTIQAGIDAASSGDTVLVSPGLYAGVGNRSLDLRGKVITLRSASGTDSTLIDCESQSRAFEFYHGETPEVLVSGFTVINGDATNGGAVRCRYNSGPTISDCVFESNRAYANGGVLFSTAGSDPILVNNTFRNNLALARGGALFSEGGLTNVTGCTFAGNDALYGGAVYLDHDFVASFTDCEFSDNASLSAGGALYDTGSSPQLTECRFLRNIASGGDITKGGGLTSENSDNTHLSGCLFSDNRAEGMFSWGGGVSVDMGSAMFVQCLFTGNAALATTSASGGGVYCYNQDDQWGPPCEFSSCSFEHNVCSGQGGGLSCEHTRAPVSDCAFLANEAAVGGGAYLQCHAGSVTSCLFASNTATIKGGGMSTYSTATGLSPLLSLLTVCANDSPLGAGLNCSGSEAPSLSNSIVAFNEDGEAIACDPALLGMSLACCDLYGHDGGDWEGCVAGQNGLDGNMCEDPLFCSALTSDFSLDAASPCAPASNPECGLIGAFDVGCQSTAVLRASWGGIKTLFR